MILVVGLHDTELAGLVRWGARFAYSDGLPLRVLCLPRGGVSGLGEEPIECTGEGDAPCSELAALAIGAADDVPGVECSVWEAAASKRAETVLRQVAEWSPTLLILGKQAGGRDISQEIFRKVPCTTVLMRLGGADGRDFDRLVMPAGGGRHSREALRIGTKLARGAGATAVPLFVEPPTDELSKEVGQRFLDDILKRARIDADDEHLHPQVVLSNNLGDGIAKVCEDNGTDLILMGDSGAGTLQRALFGTVPDRLLNEEDGTSVAILRRQTPIGERARERLGRLLQLTIPQLEREERIDLFRRFEEGGKWSFDFMALIGLSTLIAAFGLIQNSTAVVIGAMLVAPLMTPLLGAGLALVQRNRPLAINCAKAILLGFLSALAIGFTVGALFGPAELTPELRGRCAPTLFDLGVAFFSGVAASYCVARPKLSSALAGVAIAAALVPPIATVGICLGVGEFGNGANAAQLFGTNVIAIILGASTNFFLAGVRGQSGEARPWLKAAWFGLAVAGVLTIIALWSLSTGAAKPAALERDLRIIASRESQLDLVSVARTGDTIQVELRSPPDVLIDEPVKEMRALIETTYPEARARITLTPMTILESTP